MQLLILFSTQSFTQMTRYYTPIRNLTDRYAQVSCRVYHSVCKGSCAKQFNIPHSYQSIARSKRSDYWMFMGAPAYTGDIPKGDVPHSTHLPNSSHSHSQPVPIKKLLTNFKIFAGLNIQLRKADQKSLLLRQALSLFFC